MASSAVLGLIIEAENRASRSLDTVTGDIDDMGDAADKANKKFASLKSVMGTGLKVAGAAAAAGVAAVGAVMVSSVRMAADAEEALSKFNVVFNDTEGTAAAVTSEMDAFAKASGRNKYALREMAAGFGDVLKPMGFTVEEAGGLSTEMTQLAIDLGSFNNMRPEEAFERLSSTLIGNHANALSFGVIINEAVLKEELLAMGADDLTGALLEQAKVQARINILMRGTTDAQGDAIRTSDSWTNQMLRLNSVIDESRTALGLRLLPVFTPLLKGLGDLAEIYLPKAADALAGFVEGIDTEAIIADLETLFAGLETGTINLPTVYIDIKPKVGSWLVPDGEGGWMIAEGTKREVSIGDFFTFKNVTGESAEGSTGFSIFKLFGIGDETLIIDGVQVAQKAKIGDLFEGEWTADEGITSLKLGGIDVTNFVDNVEMVQGFYLGLGQKAKAAFTSGFKGEGDAAADFDETGGAFAKEPEWLTRAEAISTSIQTAFDDAGARAADNFLANSLILEEQWAAGKTSMEEASTTIQATWEATGQAASTAFNDTVVSTVGAIVWPAWNDWEEWNDWTPWEDWEDWKPWPDKPNWWKWPTDTPGWVNTLVGLFSGGGGGDDYSDYGDQYGGDGGGSNVGPIQSSPGLPGGALFPGGAVGKGFTTARTMMVGEAGPELVNLPRGSQIYSAGQTAQMGTGGVTVNVAATVNNEQDAYVLARQVANIMQRGY